ncbi:polysaccharide pyruvyl transferase family protein [Vibrio cholerae]|nr:hypothetical protein [Vibrio cholerae]ELJ8716832.1 polysaccharide pyruvyl transferase family protein [Vibrio cholerae]
MVNLTIVCESKGDNLGDLAIYRGLNALLDTEKTLNIRPLQLSFEKKRKDVSRSNEDLKYLHFYSDFYKRIPVLHMLFLMLRLLAYNFGRLSKIRKLIEDSDFVIFGGGSLLINNKLVFPLNLLFISCICRLKNVKYAVAGVSTRHVESTLARCLLRTFLKNSEFIYVRDENSIDLCLKQFGVEALYCPDFALCQKLSQTREIKYSFAINVMGRQTHGMFSNEIVVDTYKDKIKKVIEQCSYSNIALFTTGEESDYLIARQIIDEMCDESQNRVEIIHPETYEQLFSVYEKTNIIFATRLHSALIGISQGKTLCCFNWDSKVEGAFKSLGYEHSLVSLDDDFYFKINHARKLEKPNLSTFDGFKNRLNDYVR